MQNAEKSFPKDKIKQLTVYLILEEFPFWR